jgi:S-adenosylmethionine:tRNA ribosyltransferase-isomerase
MSAADAPVATHGARVRRLDQPGVAEGRAATEPPEARGLRRDEVRLLAAEPSRVRHRIFRDLPGLLEPGDLVVVNTSGTLPAAIDATRADGRVVVVHAAGPSPDGRQVVEMRRPDGAGPVLDGEADEVLTLRSGVEVRLLRPVMPPSRRLWMAAVRLDGPFEDHLGRHGRPITYDERIARLPLSAYQPAVARVPGSAEMASAGRPLTAEVITDLVTRGVGVAPVTLHAGVSSLEAGESPPSERFEVPEATARLVRHTRRHGGRVIAVGTTVTRALESVAGPGGTVRAGRGWTDLVLGPERPARVVDGLVTGWHEPASSHLRLLEAVAGAGLVRAAYAEAVQEGYLWHEFGDSCLLLPDHGPSRVSV